MITIYNIRGTNGSGKSTLARSFIQGNPEVLPNRPGLEGSPTMVDLCWYDSPTKADPRRRKAVEGYCSPSAALDVLVVGSYRTACGGLDAVPDFATTFAALNGAVQVHMRHGTLGAESAIVAEGVLASTVWGSWGDYAQTSLAKVAFCYLDTPLEVCLERIKGRQEAAGKVRLIKEDLVADKIRAIKATRAKALAAGALVYDLPYQDAEEALRLIMRDGICAVNDPREEVPAREMFRARP